MSLSSYAMRTYTKSKQAVAGNHIQPLVSVIVLLLCIGIGYGEW